MVRFINLKFGWYFFYKNSNTRQFKHLQKKKELFDKWYRTGIIQVFESVLFSPVLLIRMQF